MGSNGTHVIFRLEVSVPFVLSWDINAHQPFLGWMISSNVVSKCCQPMNHWSLCFSKRLYSEDTDYSVQATQMSKPWWINSELPPKKMSSATNIGTSPMINSLQYITMILQKHRDDPYKHCTLLVSYGWKHQLCTILPARSLHWGCSVLRSSRPGLTGSHEPVMAREASNKKR